MLGRGRHGEPLQADVAAGGGMEENHVMNEFQTATAVRRFIDSVSASLDRSDLIVQLILGFRGFLDRPLVRNVICRALHGHGFYDPNGWFHLVMNTKCRRTGPKSVSVHFSHVPSRMKRFADLTRNSSMFFFGSLAGSFEPSRNWIAKLKRNKLMLPKTLGSRN